MKRRCDHCGNTFETASIADTVLVTIATVAIFFLFWIFTYSEEACAAGGMELRCHIHQWEDLT